MPVYDQLCMTFDSKFRLLAGSTIYNESMLSENVLNNSEETESAMDAIYRSVHRNNTANDNEAEVTDRIMAMCRNVKATSHNGTPPQLTATTSHNGTRTQLTETTSHNRTPPQLTDTTSQISRETPDGLMSQRNEADLHRTHNAVAIQLSDTSTHKHNTINIMNDVTTQLIRRMKKTAKTTEALKYDTVEILPGNIDSDYDYAVDVESETGMDIMLSGTFQNENKHTIT